MNEVLRTLRHDHMDVGVQFFQAAGEIRRFIGGDAAGDAKEYCFSVQHGETPFCWFYSS